MAAESAVKEAEGAAEAQRRTAEAYLFEEQRKAEATLALLEAQAAGKLYYI